MQLTSSLNFSRESTHISPLPCAGACRVSIIHSSSPCHYCSPAPSRHERDHIARISGHSSLAFLKVGLDSFILYCTFAASSRQSPLRILLVSISSRFTADRTWCSRSAPSKTSVHRFCSRLVAEAPQVLRLLGGSPAIHLFSGKTHK